MLEKRQVPSEIEIKNRDKKGDRFERMGGWGLGPKGICICPCCGYTIEHCAGVPCFQLICPNCATRLRRKK